MEKEKLQKIRLGLFVIAGTTLFVTSMYFIGDKQELFGSTFQINAIFSNVNGLQKGNNVRFSGIDVGTVKNIKIQNDTSIMVIMIIREDVREFIKKDAVAMIGTDGLMGNKLINIKPESISSQVVVVVVVEGDTLSTYQGSDTDQMLKRLERTNTNIVMITNSLVGIIKEIEEGKGTIGKLVTDTSLAQNIDETLLNLKESSKKTTKILKSIEENIQHINLGEGTVGSLLMDTVFASNVEGMIKELMIASSNTKEITEEIQELIINIKKGQGIVGSIIADSTLARNLEKSVENIQLGSEAFNENMEALKHNFLFRGYFKRQEKKRKK